MRVTLPRPTAVAISTGAWFVAYVGACLVGAVLFPADGVAFWRPGLALGIASCAVVTGALCAMGVIAIEVTP